MIVKDNRSPRGRVEPDVQRTSMFDIPSDIFQPQPEGHDIGKDRLRWLFRASQPYRKPWTSIQPTVLICIACRKEFLTKNPTLAKTCSSRCRQTIRRHKAA